MKWMFSFLVFYRWKGTWEKHVGQNIISEWKRKLDDITETVFQTSDGKDYFPIRFLSPFDRSLKDVH